MNELKFQLTTFGLVAFLAFGGYWAFATLDRGITYQSEETVSVVDIETEPTEVIEPVPAENEVVTEQPTVASNTPLSAEDEQTLAELEDLIVDNIFMKEGSRGTRVGTVQKFLNTYLDEQSRVDNQYGPGTLRRVKTFQEREGLEADGLAGPSTYRRMADILKQG